MQHLSIHFSHSSTRKIIQTINFSCFPEELSSEHHLLIWVIVLITTKFLLSRYNFSTIPNRWHRRPLPSAMSIHPPKMQKYWTWTNEIIFGSLTQVTYHLKFIYGVLAGVAQWTLCWPTDQKVAGSIPGQGTCLGGGPGPQLGTCKRQPIDVSLTHRCFSPSLSPSLIFSLKINKNKNL